MNQILKLRAFAGDQPLDYLRGGTVPVLRPGQAWQIDLVMVYALRQRVSHTLATMTRNENHWGTRPDQENLNLVYSFDVLRRVAQASTGARVKIYQGTVPSADAPLLMEITGSVNSLAGKQYSVRWEADVEAFYVKEIPAVPEGEISNSTQVGLITTGYWGNWLRFRTGTGTTSDPFVYPPAIDLTDIAQPILEPHTATTSQAAVSDLPYRDSDSRITGETVEDHTPQYSFTASAGATNIRRGSHLMVIELNGGAGYVPAAAGEVRIEESIPLADPTGSAAGDDNYTPPSGSSTCGPDWP